MNMQLIRLARQSAAAMIALALSISAGSWSAAAEDPPAEVVPGFSLQLEWQALAPRRLNLPEGDRARRLDDHSVLFVAPGPASSMPEILYDPPLRTITHLRFEALNDPSLPGGGPGRAEGGQFLLFELEPYRVLADDPRSRKYLEFGRVWANEETEEQYADGAIDWQSDTGWLAPSAQHPHASVVAVFEFREPLQLQPGERLALRFDAGHSDHRTPGRVRISAACAASPSAEE